MGRLAAAVPGAMQSVRAGDAVCSVLRRRDRVLFCQQVLNSEHGVCCRSAENRRVRVVQWQINAADAGERDQYVCARASRWG